MIEFFKQPPVVGAIIVVIGAAIIVPLVKKFYFDVQNRLRVDLRAWNYKISEDLKKTVREPLNAKMEFFTPMRTLIIASGYMTITITNISKKKIAGVTIMAPDPPNMVCQIDDADEMIEVKKGQPIGVGDIQPKHYRVIHMWSNVDISDFDFSVVKRLLRISADELDSVHLRFPMPRYLWKKYEPRLILLFTFLFYGALFISIYLGFIR